MYLYHPPPAMVLPVERGGGGGDAHEVVVVGGERLGEHVPLQHAHRLAEQEGRLDLRVVHVWQ